MSRVPGYCRAKGCELPASRTGYCASHDHVARKEKREKNKPKAKQAPLQRSAFTSTRTAIKKVSPTNLKNTSNGERLTEKEIKERLQYAFSQKAYATDMSMACDCCEQSTWDDHDHTISKKRCKELGKTELVYDVDNIEYSCRECHVRWESYKSGEFRLHKNFQKRMDYMKIHDYESWVKRMEVAELFNRPTQTV